MASSQFPIPQKFKAELRYVDAKDHRTDAEILAALAQPPPITSEKNIWTYWHAGVSKIPSWCQRNICNWVRLHGSEWNVRVLDTVPESPNHALKWISPDDLPECFVKGTMTGPYTGPHSADFLRGAILYAYGGVWMDVGCIVFRHMDKICWDQLADENSPYTVSAPNMFAQYMANHMVSARKGDIFIKKWHELFLHFWEGKSDHSEIVQSPLIGFVHDFDFSQSEQKGFHWEFKVDPLFVLGYVGQVIAWMRVAFLKEPNGGFDGVEYYANKVLLFDSLTEDWAAETVVGFKGEDLFKVFTTRLDADSNSEEYKKAHDCAWRLLTKSCMQKITHGKGLTHDMHCGALLDLPENEGNDYQPGTFGELLRYGSVHFEQTRETINYAEPERPDPKMIIHKGLTEA